MKPIETVYKDDQKVLWSFNVARPLPTRIIHDIHIMVKTGEQLSNSDYVLVVSSQNGMMFKVYPW